MGGGAWWAAVHGDTKSRTWPSDFTFTFHFSLSCIGEGNGNLLQCSCLENPRDGGAWWAAVYGVTESQTRLKRLSSSSSKSPCQTLLPFSMDQQLLFEVVVSSSFLYFKKRQNLVACLTRFLPTAVLVLPASIFLSTLLPCCHHVIQFRGIKPSLSSDHHSWLKVNLGPRWTLPSLSPGIPFGAEREEPPSSLEMRIWAWRYPWPWLLCSE